MLFFYTVWRNYQVYFKSSESTCLVCRKKVYTGEYRYSKSVVARCTRHNKQHSTTALTYSEDKLRTAQYQLPVQRTRLHFTTRQHQQQQCNYLRGPRLLRSTKHMANFRVCGCMVGFRPTQAWVWCTAYVSTTARIPQINNNNNNNINFRHRSNFWWSLTAVFVVRPSVVGDYVTEMLHKFFLCCSVNVIIQLYCVCKIGMSRLQYAILCRFRDFYHKFTNKSVNQVVIFVETILSNLSLTNNFSYSHTQLLSSFEITVRSLYFVTYHYASWCWCKDCECFHRSYVLL